MKKICNKEHTELEKAEKGEEAVFCSYCTQEAEARTLGEK